MRIHVSSSDLVKMRGSSGELFWAYKLYLFATNSSFRDIVYLKPVSQQKTLLGRLSGMAKILWTKHEVAKTYHFVDATSNQLQKPSDRKK